MDGSDCGMRFKKCLFFAHSVLPRHGFELKCSSQAWVQPPCKTRWVDAEFRLWKRKANTKRAEIITEHVTHVLI